MDYGIESKLRKFLTDKMSKCLDNAKECEKKHLKDVLSDIRQCDNLYGFALETEDKNWRGEIVYTFKKSEETITIYCGIYEKKKHRWSTRPLSSLKIGEVSSSSYYIDRYPNLVYQVFEHSGEIEEEFFALKSKLEKEAKIADISEKSIATWLATMLADTGYQYYITKDEHKLTLSVRMCHGVQLDIPIYFNKFQKIMPDLLATIKEYENLIDNNKVKVLISNLKAKEKWQNQKS
jgi:hypothetical protein